MTWRAFGAVASIWCVSIFAGCATTNNPVSILYIPSFESKGGTGELFLKSPKTHVGSESYVRWVIGKRKDSDGMVTGEILSEYSAEFMVLDALKRELTVAGYNVEAVGDMPPGVSKGLDLASIKVDLEEIAGIPKIKDTGMVKVSMDVWKNGVRVKNLSYESKVSGFAVIKRRNLSREIIEKGLRGVMRQAVPEIVAVLERKSAS